MRISDWSRRVLFRSVPSTVIASKISKSQATILTPRSKVTWRSNDDRTQIEFVPDSRARLQRCYRLSGHDPMARAARPETVRLAKARCDPDNGQRHVRISDRNSSRKGFPCDCFKAPCTEATLIGKECVGPVISRSCTIHTKPNMLQLT